MASKKPCFCLPALGFFRNFAARLQKGENITDLRTHLKNII
jgi:hypothetical protein